MKFKPILLSSVAWAAAFAAHGAASAQAVDDPVADAVEVDDVIVTARRRSERTQDLPGSVTAFGAESIARLGISSPQDLALRTPGLRFGNFQDLKLSPTSLRGVSASTGSAGQDPAVAYYLDEVYLGPGVGASIDYSAVDRIEVLRGPQGTVFGRSAIGGAISAYTQRPTWTPAGRIEATVGNYDTRRANLSLSGPIIADVLAGRLSASANRRDGFTRLGFTGGRGDDERSEALSAGLVWRPAEGQEWYLTADYRHVDQSALNFETQFTVPPSAALNGLLIAELGRRGLPLNTNAYDRTVFPDTEGSESLEAAGVMLRGEIMLGDLALTSVTSYRRHDYHSEADTDRSPLRFIYDGDPETARRFSQEFRLAQDRDGWRWLAGVYYLGQETENQSFVDVGEDLASLLLGSAVRVRSGSHGALDLRSYSAFASFGIDLTPELQLTLGGRYTRESKDIDYVQRDALGLVGGDIALKAGDDWDAFTPNADLRYRFSRDMLAYITVSRGFKSGGFNDGLGSADGIAFDPEFLWNYEAGFKTDWFDRRLRINAAIYYMDWSDVQIRADNPATPNIFDPFISNAGAAHSAGIELEVRARPRSDLELTLVASRVEAKYDEGSLPAPGGAGGPLDRLPFSPEFSVTAAADFRRDIGNGWSLSVRPELVAQGEQFLDISNAPLSRVGPFTLANLTATAEHGAWTATLYANNLGDRAYRQRYFDLSRSPPGQIFTVLGQPRTFGIRLRYAF